jgi:hypothetical protein
MRALSLPLAAAFLVACSSSFTPADSGTTNNNSDSGITNEPDSGNQTTDAGEPTDAGDAGTCIGNCTTDAGEDAGEPEDAGKEDAGPKMPKVTTVQALVGVQATNPHLELVELNKVVVVALHDVSASTTPTVFYVQDRGAAGPGLMVAHAGDDTAPIPAVGDVVTVTGQAGVRNGVLSVASSKPAGVMLSVVVDATDGGVSGGAYPPAGNPITNSSTTAYAITADAGTAEIGNVLKFTEALTITDKNAITVTNNDGGSVTLGFAVTGNMYVYDGYLRGSGCLRPDGGLTLPHGIEGVWDRYQPEADVDAGTTIPVLYLMNCSDLTP